MSRIERIRKNKQVSAIHERTQEEHQPRKGKRLVPVIVVLLLSGLLYLLFFSKAFTIDNIEIQGYSNPEVIENIIASACEQSFYGYNILLFNSGNLEDTIKEDSGVRAVSVKKVLPRTVKVEVDESTAVIAWRTAGENFGIDDRGYVISENKELNLPQVTDLLNIEVALGERVASPTFIKFIKDIDENFETITGVKYDEIIIYDILSDVRIKSVNSWTVYLDASRDPVAQLENLVRVLSEAREEGHKSLEYIDMRLPDRVFYQ